MIDNGETMMVSLTDESKKRIESYVKKNYLDGEIYASLWKARSRIDIINAFKSQLSVNEITSPKIWVFVIHSVWVSIDEIFDKQEIILLKGIIKDNGVTTRNRISEELTQYMTTKAIASLEERGIVEVLTLTSNEKLIIIHPKFRYEIFKDGETNNTTTRRE